MHMHIISRHLIHKAYMHLSYPSMSSYPPYLSNFIIRFLTACIVVLTFPGISFVILYFLSVYFRSSWSQLLIWPISLVSTWSCHKLLAKANSSLWLLVLAGLLQNWLWQGIVAISVFTKLGYIYIYTDRAWFVAAEQIMQLPYFTPICSLYKAGDSANLLPRCGIWSPSKFDEVH